MEPTFALKPLVGEVGGEGVGRKVVHNNIYYQKTSQRASEG